jgi:integrase
MQVHSAPSSRSVRVSGTLYVRQGKRGPVWYTHLRGPDFGKRGETRKPLPWENTAQAAGVWTAKGRPAEGFYTRKTAEDRLAALLTDARRGLLNGPRKTSATFEDAAAEWLRYVEHDRKRRVSTVTDYRRLVDHDLTKEFGTIPLEELTTERVEQYRNRLVMEGKLSARSINKRLIATHAILRRAQRVHGLLRNVASSSLIDRQPLKRSGDFRVLPPADVEALARAAVDEQDAALFRVAAYTGLRLGELRALRWCDVDFEKALVHVRRSYTYGVVDAPKSGKVRSVPLVDQAARALDRLSRRDHFTDDDDLVFPGMTGGVFDDSAMRRRFKAALAAAALKPARFHDLRHSFGTLAVQAFPLSDVQAYMGHSAIQTTMIYVHHRPQVDAAEKLSALVASASSTVVGHEYGGRTEAQAPSSSRARLTPDRSGIR